MLNINLTRTPTLSNSTIVCTLCTILRYPFLVTYPKIFLSCLWRQYILSLRGGAPKNNPIFWSTFSKKSLFWPVFSKFCLRCRESDQNRVFFVLWQGSESQFSRPRKKFDKIFEFFLKIHPHRENPRSAPGLYYYKIK